MKAVVYEKYGPPDVLQIRDVPKSTPKDNEALIKIHATSAAASEALARRGESIIGRLIIGIRGPRRRNQVLGMELAGVVEAVGQDVTCFKPCDSVFASCGLIFGGYAEYKCLSETKINAHKPAAMSYVEAAAVPLGAARRCGCCAESTSRTGSVC